MTCKTQKTGHVKRSLEPFLLEVFLANRCNMDCSYCSSRYMIREKEAKALTFDQLKRAVDVISLQSRGKYMQDRFGGRVGICFTGGEPLLKFGVLKEAISYICKKEPDFEIEVVTNGTLLTKDRMDFFARNNVEICLRLDGRRRVNDLCRKFTNNRKKSAFEAVMSNLSLISERYGAHFHIRTTPVSQTIDSLPDTVKFFRHDVGCKQLEIELEGCEIWSGAGINRLRNTLKRLKAGFLTMLAHETDIKNMEFAFREFLFSQCDGTDYRELAKKAVTLFCDGYFYLSNFVVKPPLERKYIVGDLERGIDFKRLEAISSSPMFADISRKCLRSRCKSGLLSPAERYCWGVVHKFTPDKMNKLLENTSLVNGVFSEEMDCYVKLQKIYARLVAAPAFGDFAHSPKCRSDKEIRNFRLTIWSDSDIVRLREGIDYFLYSPGSAKKLVLDVMTGAAPAKQACSAPALQALDVMEGMILYVLVKAGYLKTKIELTVACAAGDASVFDEARRRYLNENGVRAAVPVYWKRIGNRL